MSKLIVLSNRVSLPNPEKKAAGGLAVAMQDALHDIGGVWVGWNGERVEQFSQLKFDSVQHQGVEYLTSPLTEQQYQQYYCGFANNALWPAMHDRSDLIEYSTDEYLTYQEVNRMFAEQLQAIAEPDDVIWVHDYHFFSIARHCRQLGMHNKIGFFLHIPFAHEAVWREIPVASRLLQDLCEYDVVGLQTQRDQQQCMRICQTMLSGEEIHPYILRYQNKLTMMKSYPIGVNPDLIQHAAAQPLTSTQDIFDFDSLAQQKTIIGVDRIDYSKGLLERFDAFAHFLASYPEYHQQVVDLQIACPCRMDIPAYQRLYQRLEDQIDAINSQYATADWLPVNCSHQTLAHEVLMKIYRQSDICWVTSLKDGMNLVAKEYIAAQDANDPGVLILSDKAGAADQMPDALIVNPHDREAMTRALKQALEMPRAERIQRYSRLMDGLKKFDIADWHTTFLNDLRHNSFLYHYKMPLRAQVSPVIH
ncbi:alpha,alpha-trehalose-phosphate synthase (UDP-forming) [Acinetobacter indicus]|uniref:alpha,alpha-trehalose-phosphate synthase (UDP-forming) n=1 Tax=Acinetobacter indicus TaxID=756892 RepID=UPI003989C76A